jgi:phage terminase large subunit-like protein
MNKALIVNKLINDKIIEKARTDFKFFCKIIGNAIDPNHIFNDKYQKILIDNTQYFLNNKDLFTYFIEAPIRSGKTEIITTYNIARLLTIHKDKKFLVATGSKKLKTKIIRDLLRLLNSSIYKKLFNLEIEISNQEQMTFNNGCKIDFITAGSAIPTGEGYHFIFLEDFLTRTTYYSLAKRENAFEQLHGVLGRKQHDPATKIIVCNQRFGEGDLSEYLANLYKEFNVNVLKITIPYIFRIDTEYILPTTNEIIQFKENEFLVPWFNQKEMQRTIAELGGMYAFEAECQQNPQVKQGQFFKRELIESVQVPISLINEKKGYYVISVDTASGLDESNDFTAITILKCIQEYHGYDIYVNNIIRCKLTGYDLCQKIKILSLETYKNNNMILIEENHIGSTLINFLKNDFNIDAKGIKRTGGMKTNNNETLKEDMAMSINLKMHERRLFFPLDNEVNFMYDLKNEMFSFPYGKHDDQIDSIANAIYYLRKINVY